MRFLIALLACMQVYLAYGQQCPQWLCSSDQTCCHGPFPGTYGCCPLAEAVCCSDGLHCCPEGTLCDLANGTCDYISGLDAGKRDGTEDNARVVYCTPSTYCQDGNTCCQTPQGEWRCCPFLGAACCRDGFHCCRHGQVCDATSRYCNPAGNPFLQVASELSRPAAAAGGLDAGRREDNARVVYCTSTTYCPDGNTCCQTPQGEWRCCPFQGGSCCRDGLYCCRHGMRCDAASRHICYPAGNPFLRLAGTRSRPATVLASQDSV